MPADLEQRRLRRSAKRTLAAVIVAWAALAVLFAFTDLDISKAIAHTGSPLGLFIENYGDIPGLLIILFAGLVMIGQLSEKKGWAQVVLQVILFLLSVFIVFYMALELTRPISGLSAFIQRRWVFFSLGFAAGTGLCLRWAWVRAKGFADRHPSFADLTLRLALFAYLVFVQLLKGVLGRVRFRDLAAGYANFTRFYQPRGFTGDLSFPSGHAVMGWMLLPLLILVWGRNKTLRAVVLGAIIAWALLVSYARVLVGAHFASDVLFSTGASLVCFLILIRRRGVLSADGRGSV